MAEKKFYDIAAAKEVLSDPGTDISVSSNRGGRVLGTSTTVQHNKGSCMISLRVCFVSLSDLRQRFDDGEDPLDPEQNTGGGFHGNPFGGGGPFGHGGFTFKFKFN